MLQSFFSFFASLWETGAVLLVAIGLLFFNNWLFKHLESGTSSHHVSKRFVGFFIVLMAVVAFILSLPITNTTKGQILSFLGIIISAGIALSSTTVLGNIIAGIMNNSMNRFKNGDLIRIGDLHGRVTRKSIFHTELQLEDSNFITVPNLFIATNPVKLTRKTNSVISTTVSLGYDVSRAKIEEALLQAAKDTGLTDPYVYITQLGDFSVVYKIHGFLDDSNTFFSTNSLLNANVMDALHKKSIEIVSPTFMNQRQVNEQRFIPKYHVQKPDNIETSTPESLVFDEAIKSEKIENKKEYLQQLTENYEELKRERKELKDKEAIEKAKKKLEQMEDLKKRIETNIEEQRDSQKG